MVAIFIMWVPLYSFIKKISRHFLIDKYIMILLNSIAPFWKHFWCLNNIQYFLCQKIIVLNSIDKIARPNLINKVYYIWQLNEICLKKILTRKTFSRFIQLYNLMWLFVSNYRKAGECKKMLSYGYL